MFDNVTTHVHVLTVRLHIPHAQSLKDKRMVIHRTIRFSQSL
ncbi:MAG: DUF503 family protein [Candidatus Omnitrophica bacterium]|nr:DUF503 family protein [Candidatus Omnitrophota bacterium]